MFFQVRNAAEFSRHIPFPAHAAPYSLRSPQTMLGPNHCQGWQTPKAAVLLPGDIAGPWPQLQPQPTAAVGTRESGARRFCIITYQARSQNPLSLHRHPMPDNTNISSSLSPRLGFLQRSPHIYAMQLNPKEQGLGPIVMAQLVASL